MLYTFSYANTNTPKKGNVSYKCIKIISQKRTTEIQKRELFLSAEVSPKMMYYEDNLL